MPTVLTVKQLNTYVRSLLDGEPKLNLISVSGEISNLKNHYSSGHIYFSLKDSDAVIRCVMFRPNAIRLTEPIKDGDKVICTGKASIYEKDGQYQLYVEGISKSGIGDLSEQFRLIKEKLENEGLFDSAHKRSLPAFPKKIAVITSDSGAALQDIINIISRRYPICEVLVIPALVQGISSAGSVISALNTAYKMSGIDIIIVARGGGSAEDLFSFNDERLARTIYASPIPVISAIGHETDFTISDFVADLRAPTPSAAAELAVPDIKEIKEYINALSRQMSGILSMKLNRAELALQKAVSNEIFINPSRLIQDKYIEIDRLFDRLNSAQKNIIAENDTILKTLSAKLDALSPLKAFSRGYSVALKDSKTVKSIEDLAISDKVEIVFNDGDALAVITEINKGDNNDR